MAIVFKFTSQKAKEWVLRQHLIAYYDTINQGEVSVPSFMLADEDIKKVKSLGTLNYWYRKLERAS